MREQLLERAKDFNIILDDVSITDLSFGREYTAAVEAKQVGKCDQCYGIASLDHVIHCSSTRSTEGTVHSGEGKAGEARKSG